MIGPTEADRGDFACGIDLQELSGFPITPDDGSRMTRSPILQIPLMALS